MLRAFHSNKIASRQYVMGIFPDNFENMPFKAQDEHHELIVLDVNCNQNLEHLINEVYATCVIVLGSHTIYYISVNVPYAIKF